MIDCFEEFINIILPNQICTVGENIIANIEMRNIFFGSL